MQSNVYVLGKTKRKKKEKEKKRKKHHKQALTAHLSRGTSLTTILRSSFVASAAPPWKGKKKRLGGGTATIDIRSPNSVRETEGERSETGTQRHRERERVFVFLLWGVGSTHFH